MTFVSFGEEGEWIRKADMPTARADLAACVLDRKIITFGGSNKVGTLASVEEYDTGFKSQTVNNIGRLSSTWGNIKYDK